MTELKAKHIDYILKNNGRCSRIIPCKECCFNFAMINTFGNCYEQNVFDIAMAMTDEELFKYLI